MSTELTRKDATRLRELLDMWSSSPGMPTKLAEELEELMEFDQRGYGDPEYLSYAAEMDALIEASKEAQS